MKDNMKVLNLYSGIGGNRKLWKNVNVTAVEIEEKIAAVYADFYPNDNMIISDAHEYLLKHHEKYDFIWSSPPCPTHSKSRLSLTGYGLYVYPDMRLYQEIIFLNQFFKKPWVVENVIPYYNPLIGPTFILDRHFFWASKSINADFEIMRNYNVNRATKEDLAEFHGINLPEKTKGKRALLRNCVNPKLGNYVFEQLTKI